MMGDFDCCQNTDSGDKQGWEFTVLDAHQLKPGDIIRMNGPGSYDIERPSDGGEKSDV